MALEMVGQSHEHNITHATTELVRRLTVEGLSGDAVLSAAWDIFLDKPFGGDLVLSNGVSQISQKWRTHLHEVKFVSEGDDMGVRMDFAITILDKGRARHEDVALIVNRSSGFWKIRYVASNSSIDDTMVDINADNIASTKNIPLSLATFISELCGALKKPSRAEILTQKLKQWALYVLD